MHYGQVPSWLSDRMAKLGAIMTQAIIHLHSFIVTDEGKWAVIQQGMNTTNKQARRYHWLSEGLESFIDAPHAAIEGRHQGHIINLIGQRARLSRSMQIELLKTLSPER